MLEIFCDKFYFSGNALTNTALNLFLRSETLKALTNEKRGGLSLVSFDWSRFKLFTLKISKESVLTPSCGRTKTAQRTLFLSFEISVPRYFQNRIIMFCLPVSASAVCLFFCIQIGRPILEIYKSLTDK
jgi:hypothetical protein